MSGPMAPPVGNVGNVDRGPTIMAILWAQTVVCTIVMALRFWARISIKALGMDDWVMLFTLMNFFIFDGFITVQALHGGDRHVQFVAPDQQTLIVKLSWVSQPFAIMAICLAKVSVAFLLLRLIGPKPKWPRYFLYFTMISSLIITVIDIVFTFAQCTPARALWEPNIPHTCWRPTIQSKFAIFTASYLVFIDAALAILPIFIFGRLKMSIKKRAGVCVLLGSGIIAAVCGAVKTSYLNELSARTDITWASYDIYVWSASELFILILCGSIPPLKILYDKYVGKTIQGSVKSSQYSNMHTDDSYPLKSFNAESKVVPTVVV